MGKTKSLPARVHVAVSRVRVDRARGGGDVAPARVILYNIFINIMLRGSPCIRRKTVNCL